MFTFVHNVSILVDTVYGRDYVLMKTVFIGAIVGSGDGEDDDKEILIW
jgi:hypothetical protein